jgi:hypothetical protein
MKAALTHHQKDSKAQLKQFNPGIGGKVSAASKSVLREITEKALYVRN